jgi:nucleoside-diphosphate-sugar epimerase
MNPDLPLGFGKIPYGPRQVMYLCADISMLTRDTGFAPETDFETGIAETIDWLQKEKCNENH